MCGHERRPSVGDMDTADVTPPARTAVVTGASRGLGRALAAWLAGAGYALVIDARDPDALESARGGPARRRHQGPGGRRPG